MIMRTFETMTGDVIDTFRITTQAVNQTLSIKVDIRQVPATVSQTQTLNMSMMSCYIHSLQPPSAVYSPMFKRFAHYTTLK